MKKCKNCGSRNPDDATVCVECKAEFPGTASSDKTASSVTVPQQTSAQAISLELDYSQPQQPQKAPIEATGKAVVSLVLGIVGLFISLFAFAIPFVPSIVGAILSLIGIILAVKARNRIPVGVSGRGIATAGMTFSILGLIFGLIISLIWLCAVLSLAALCSSAACVSYDYTAYDYTILFSIL